MTDSFISVNTPNGNIHVAGSELPDGRISQEVTLYTDGAVTSSDNPLPVVEHRSHTSVLTTVDVADTKVTLLAAMSSRHTACIHNHSNDQLFISYGPDCNSMVFTQVLAAHAYFELNAPMWTGVITAIRPSGAASGPVMVTELS